MGGGWGEVRKIHWCLDGAGRAVPARGWDGADWGGMRLQELIAQDVVILRKG